MAQKPKVLVLLREGHGGLFMLNEQFERGQEQPVYENTDPGVVYEEALVRVEQRKSQGFDVALEVKSRLFN